jgi:hypothetical protein
MVRRIVDCACPPNEILRAKITDGLTRTGQRYVVDHHVAAIATKRVIPDRTPRRLLEQRAVVLSTAHDDVRDVVVGDVVEFKDAHVADNRAPDAGVGRRR